MRRDEAVAGTIARVLAGSGEGDPATMRAILDEGFEAYRKAPVQGVTIIVCGGRDFDDVPRMWATLDRADQFFQRAGGIGLVIDGAQQKKRPDGFIAGADYWGNQWALARGKRTRRFPADWAAQGKAGGPLRNRRMLDLGNPYALFAFPVAGAENKGTKNMIEAAKASGVRVFER